MDDGLRKRINANESLLLGVALRFMGCGNVRVRRGGQQMTTIGQQIVRKLEQATGIKAKGFTVKMKGVRELRQWMKVFDDARKGPPSNTLYGEAHQ